ncbi:hypothetical protein JZX87_28385 [Agrobacterium sp. Ap1]|uniref:hypothetical protein n=1 Tax=Agrobacterium sp. Ap1 TaxID=2815337 RepID=UPI001A9001B3|nr:hypothetical protein [Agrobacterium sp. Ap1]MBO0145057.1 hypothetical protein [Agrobacterium sp. Ap1]
MRYDGKLYLIRDTFNGLRLQCQYGVKGEGTAVDWKDCRHGVNFSEIEPFAVLPVDEATVRTDALKTLHDLMTDEYVPHAIRADIAKYVIESRIG